MASNVYRIQFSGELTKDGEPPIACPHCRSTRGLTVEGRPGDNGWLRHCNRTFQFPRSWDARKALLQAIERAGQQGQIRYAR